MKRLYKILNTLEEGGLGLGLLGLAFMAFVEVVARYVFNHSFTWFEELARYMGVFLTFLGASLGVKYGLHFSMDYVVGKVRPRTARLMRMTSALIGAVLFFTIAWLAWRHSFKLLKYDVTSAAMGMPMFWAYLPICVFSFTLSLRFVHQAWRNLKGFIQGKPLATAGPVRESQTEAAE